MNAAPTPTPFAAWWAVFRKEVRSLFLTPLAWVFLASFLFLSGMLFYLGIVSSDEASLRGTLGNLAITTLFLLPLMTMRVFAEEARSGTLELLLTSPIPLGSLLLGKWLAIVLLYTVLLVLTSPFVMVLNLFGDPDPGVLLTTYLGLWLCGAAFGAVGVFTSSLTRDQMVAAVGAVLLMLPSWLASVGRDLAPPSARPWLDRVSFVEHLRSFARGVLDSADVAWFGLVTFAFLFLAWRSLESRRWR